jgi:hydrogenase-4 membrane subunit HyfE
MWLIWTIALLFGMLAAPWYAPAAISVAVATVWIAIAMQSGSITLMALSRLAIVIAAIVICWVIGRGFRHLYDRSKRAKTN